MEQKLLIIDDEEGILWLLRDYFEIQGYQVLTAGTGEEAVKLALSQAPDLILLDISLPDIDGLEVCRRIREKVNCPILFLTAKVEEQDRINGFLMGGDDYILKPFSIEELGPGLWPICAERGGAQGTENWKKKRKNSFLFPTASGRYNIITSRSG